MGPGIIRPAGLDQYNKPLRARPRRLGQVRLGEP